VNHVVHDFVLLSAIENRVGGNESIPQLASESIAHEICYVVRGHSSKRSPIGVSPPPEHLVVVSDAGEGSMKPTHPEEVEQFDFVIWRLLVSGQLLESCPVALEGALVKKAECGLLLGDFAGRQYLINPDIKITGQDLNVANQFSLTLVGRHRLSSNKLLEFSNSALLNLA
jgi:hypothetical protein